MRQVLAARHAPQGSPGLKTFHEVPPEHPESVAGTVGGTAGPISGIVTALTKENYRLRSDDRDHEASFEASSGPTTGTHIHLPEGAGAGDARHGTDAARHRLCLTQAPPLCTDALLLCRYDCAARVILSDSGSA
jgi:hypothetical protein